MKVDLPKAQAKPVAGINHQPIIVSIDARGRYYLNIHTHPKQPLRTQTLVNRVAAEIAVAKRAHQLRQVLVKGDRHVAYGKVIHAMVLLQRAGIEHVGLMTEDN